jgi:hypothetical protein
MRYPYECECGKEFEKEYPMGKAAKKSKCKCGKMAHRVYSFGVKVPDPVSAVREGRGQG